MDDVKLYNLGRQDAMGCVGVVADAMLATCNDVLADGIRWQTDSYWGGVHDQLTNDTRATTPVYPA